MKYQKKFEIDNYKFVFAIHNDSSVMFCRYELSPYSGWNFGEEEYFAMYSDLGDCRRPFSVLSFVANELKSWVKKKKPGFFSFKTDSYKKAAVYEKMIERFAGEILTDYYYLRYGDYFWFYRRIGA